MAKIKGREMQTQGQHNNRCVIEEKTEVIGVKPLRHPPSGK